MLGHRFDRVEFPTKFKVVTNNSVGVSNSKLDFQLKSLRRHSTTHSVSDADSVPDTSPGVVMLIIETPSHVLGVELSRQIGHRITLC